MSTWYISTLRIIYKKILCQAVFIRHYHSLLCYGCSWILTQSRKSLKENLEWRSSHITVSGVGRQPQNPGIRKNTKGHLVHGTFFFMEDLMYTDMDTVQNFPTTGNPFFTFPQKLISLGHPWRNVSLHIEPKWFPINIPTGHAWSVLPADMLCPSLMDLSLLDMKKKSMCPLGHVS